MTLATKGGIKMEKLNEGGSERNSDVMRILAESKRKAREAAAETLKEMEEEESLKERPLIEMKNTWSHGITGFERISREIKDYEQPSAWKWFKPIPETVRVASAKSSEKKFLGGIFGKGFIPAKSIGRLPNPLNKNLKNREVKENINLTGLVGIVNEVFRRAIELLKGTGQKRIPSIQETVSQSADMGGRWMEWKNSPLRIGMTPVLVPLREPPDVAYEVYDVWSRMAGSLVQGTEEAQGLARFFLPRRLPLKNKERGRRSLFDQGGIPQSLKTWQAWLSKQGSLPLKEFQKPEEETLTEISEMNEATPQLRSRNHGNLFRISTRRGEYDRARDSIGRSMYEGAEAVKGEKKKNEDALLANVMKTKANTEEIKDMIKRIRDKDSEPTPRERGAARSDLTKNSWVTDDLREAVMGGFRWW